MEVVDLLGTLGNAVDDAGRTLLEFADDTVDPFAQHFVDTVGEVGEFVVHMAGLEIEAVGQPLAGLKHGAGGFGAGLLETVEQVAGRARRVRGSCCRRRCSARS